MTRGGRVRASVVAAGAVGAAVAVALLAGCAAGSGGSSDHCVIDAAGYTSLQSLDTFTDAVVRGHVMDDAAQASQEPPDESHATVMEMFHVTVDDVVAVRPGEPRLNDGQQLEVMIPVIDPQGCAATDTTPTAGYQGFPLESEIPGRDADVVLFLGGGPDRTDGAVAVRTALGYASVGPDGDGSNATFHATPGGLRGAVIPLEDVVAAVKTDLTAPRRG
ncbi:hypothetical protein ACFT5B_17875 [Luteimicrobium sp. NPDC057192]|uniref:hypothetical protein n=1 Tax=Luteimicrobium sp. NPDC057192 TaxID=3346042 RepID=UPI00362E3DFE